MPLADAHVLALRHLRRGGESAVLNCGYGQGLSVRQVIAAMERIIGHTLAVTEGLRRAGDSPALVADPSMLCRLFDWHPRRADPDLIIRSALNWERRMIQRLPV